MIPTEEDGPWGVWAETCRECGVQMAIVGLIDQHERGELEAYQNGGPICNVCKGNRRMVWN